MSKHRRMLRLLLLVVLAPVASCRRETDPLQQMIRAASSLDQRPTTGRIAVFPHAPAPRRSRAVVAAAVPSAELLRIRLAASDVLAAPHRDEHAAAVALLVSGRAAESVQVLTTLTEKMPSSAVYRSDLAAARLELGIERDQPELHVAALAAADAALAIDPHYAPALFNRALALEALGLTPQAVRALTHYRTIDPTSAWANEAADRIRDADTTDRATVWSGSKVLLEQHRDVAAIVREFPQQARTSAESDYLSLWADAHVAGDVQTAARWLDLSRAIGTAQVEIRGERLLSDAVAAIDRGSDRMALANAYLTYRRGRERYKTENARVAEAVPLLQQAEREFARAASPMALVASYYHANALFDAHQATAASAILDRLDTVTPSSYRALRAQLAWLRSTLAANSGRPYAALTAALAAADQFRAIGETENAARMELAASRTLDRLGRTADGYRLRRRAFESASAAGKPSLWEVVLNSAARAEVKAQRWDAASSLFALELESPAVSPLLRFDALLWRAAAEAKVRGAGAPDLREAHAAAARAADPAMGKDMKIELQFVEAASIAPDDPTRAVTLLTGVIEARLRTTRVSNLAAAYLERARAHAYANRRAEQEADLRSAIVVYERQAGEIQRDELLDAFTGTTADAYTELTELLVEAGRLGEAFEIAEQARARGLLAFESRRRNAAAPASLQALSGRVGDDAIIIHYTALRDALLIAVIEAKRHRVFTVSTKRADVDGHTRGLKRAIMEDDVVAQRTASRWLYDQLIAPLGHLPSGRALTIVTDEALDQIPFAVLAGPSGRYLVEDFAIVRAPSARLFLAHAGEEAADVHHQQLAIIADPAIDHGTFPSLERLPGARSDIRRLAARHQATVLSDRDATPSRVMDALRNATGAHFSAHALVDENDAWKSLFLLAPEGRTDGALYLHQIMKQDLARLRVVTLAGCRTSARGANSGSVSSLAMAFLAAGSHNVIGTLWDVDDSLTPTLTTDVDAALHSGRRPAEALRSAQIEFLRSSDARYRAARHWAAFQLHGCNH